MTDGTPIDDGLLAIRSWHIVFVARERESWWDLLTSPDWRHVCAYGYHVSEACWVIYDPTETYTRVVLADDDGLDEWLMGIGPRMTAVLRTTVKAQPRPLSRLGFFCTSAIKHLLGFPSGAFRPEALYRDLKADGAEEVFRLEYGRQSETPEGRS